MKLLSELRVLMFSRHSGRGIGQTCMEYRLWDCAESSFVSVTVSRQKRHRVLLMRATEQADVVAQSRMNVLQL